MTRVNWLLGSVEEAPAGRTTALGFTAVALVTLTRAWELDET